MVLAFVIGLVLGIFLDNRFAPKVRIENGKVTFTYTDKKPPIT